MKSITGGGAPVTAAPAAAPALSSEQFNTLVSTVTDQVMAALKAAR